MFAGVIDADLPALPDRKFPDTAPALRLKTPNFAFNRIVTALETGELVAERIDAILQALIEHVANHDHSALRPLSHAAEIGMIELCLVSISSCERPEQSESCLKADSMSPRDIGHDAKPFWREILHC